MFVLIMIVWLNSDGTIAAQASGMADSVETCTKLAEGNIATQSADPRLQGKTPKFACWDTRPQAHVKAKGTVEL